MKRQQIVCACIIQNKQVLIARRATSESKGIWEFCGGKVEKDETDEAAIIREVKEEMELDVKIIKDLITIHDDTKSKPIAVHAFVCEINGGTLKLNAHDEFCWIAPENIDMHKFHCSDKPIIDALIAFLRP